MSGQEILIDAANSLTDEYARANGLSIDSQVDTSLLLAQFKRQDQLLPTVEPDDISLPQLHIPYLVPRTEQWSLSKESLKLLDHVTSLGREDGDSLKPHNLVDFAKLKLESPLLRSDPDYDIRELARSVQERRRPDIDLTSVPSEPLNTSNDESLQFPEAASQYREKLITEIQDEKIDIPRETLYYLSRLLRDEWTDVKQTNLLDELSHHVAISPPLTPPPLEEEYFIPDEEVCQIPILSDPSTLFDADLNEAETLAMSPLGELPLLEPQRSKFSSLKVEGPLTPLNSVTPSSDQEIAMSSFAKDMDIDQVLGSQQRNLFDAKSESDPNAIFGDDALAVLKDAARSAMKSIEQEQLQTADAVARIEIPIMDFSIPKPDWQQVPLDATPQFLWIIEHYEAFNIPLWPKNSQKDRELRWSPFSSRMGHISMNESIDDDGSVKALADFPDLHKVSTSADYVWKQPGLAILRELEEDEEQLELPSPRREDKDIESLVRKRQPELDILDMELVYSSGSASPVDLVQLPPVTGLALSSSPPGGQGHPVNLLLDCNDKSATRTLLSNYVDFHTSKRQKHGKSSFFPVSAKPVIKAVVETAQRTAVMAKPRAPAAPSHSPEQTSTTPAPCPKLATSPLPTKIIKALALKRGVFSRLVELYPNAEIIERDFDRWNSLSWNRNSVSRSPIVSLLAAEADVIVSPATGIIVTTLLKAMQKPLPGQKGLSAIRERIHNVALRCERLIVLVSEGNLVDETARDLTPAECAGYTDFAGFVAGLDTNTQVYYVGGGDDALTKWLVSFSMRYAPEAAEVEDTIIQEETLWEMFLRRAGMNTYAAQAILGQLKPPGDVPDDEASRYGLPGFIRMTPVERVQGFRALMGGERVLGRVNEVLETRWVD
ncbi:hypothetical protein F4677DRAFT_452119 [Hypoxylon crocopeplum]|nr:hypothetical protein F4677DRAFT_452119 [Hypoxylon crocopeplum]